jgi:two-component system phosphate regulon sensor histidine kinase PhoR
VKLTFRTKLLASYLLLVAAVELIAVFILSRSLEAELVRSLDARLEQQAYGAARWVEARHEQHGALSDKTSSDRQAIRLGAVVSAWVTIIDDRGIVIGNSERLLSSQHPDAKGEASMPEVSEAKLDHVGRASRYSAIFGEDLRYVAVLAESGEVVRLAVPLKEIQSTINAMRTRLLAAAGLAAAVALFIGLFAARLVARPLLEMKTTASRIAAGDYDIDVPVSSPDEFGVLARSLAQLARELKSRIGDLVRERDRLSAILSGMVEGVLVVGSDKRVLIANPSAARILGAPPPLEGKVIGEVVADEQLRDLIAAGVEREAAVDLGDRALLVNVRSLGSVGLVAVIHDVTQIRRLEDMRRDFVANVSHELRTPVTAIQGYAETLLRGGGGALDEKTKGEFLEIIHRHAGRIGRLVTDLLRLSEIEARAPEQRAQEILRLSDVTANVAETARDRLKQKAMTLEIEAGADLAALGDPVELEQVLDNLVDNAIKYGKAEGRVRIACTKNGTRTRIRVSDDGPGIAPDHLPRIFERFYRVDAGRSRAVGGAGLGLAIVKRLVESMGGTIEVESELGKGTVFTIELTLPAGSTADSLPRQERSSPP